MVISAPSKEVLMRDNKAWFWESKSQNRENRLSPLRSFRWLSLLLTAGLASVPAAAQCDAYVAQNASNSVWVINTMTDAPVAVIPVQFSPLGIAITPDGAFAYVTNYYWNAVSVIDTATNTAVATVAVGSGPWAVAITPNGAFAYVTNQ